MITDEMLYSAAAKSSAAFVNHMEKDYDPENQHTFSARFERKIKRLIRKANHPLLYRGLRSVASILLAILIGGGTWLAVDVEARAAFVGWIKEVYTTFFVYKYSGDAETDIQSTKYRPTFIPENYNEVFSDDAEEGGHVLYENVNGEYLQFSYIIKPDDSSFFIVNTDTIRYEIMVNTNPADYLKSENPEISDAILWINENEHAFYLSGFLDEQELIEIAESVKKIK